MHNVFNQAVDLYVPLVQVNQNNITLSSTTLAIQKNFRYLCRKLRRVRFCAPHIFFAIKSELKLSKIMLLNSIKFDLSNYYKNLLVNISDIHGFHHTVGARRGKARLKKTEAIMAADGRWVRGNEEVADLFANHFEHNHRTTFNWSSPIEGLVDDFISNFNPTRRIEFSNSCSALPNERETYPSELVTFNEVKHVVESRNNKISSGSDGLPNRLLKLLDNRILSTLTIYFNQLIACGHFPSCWKHANIIPIPKAGRNTDLVSNWRPISLLPCISKIFERLIVVRLRRFVDERGVVPGHQFGFMPRHSTSHALAILQNRINHNLNNKVVTSLVCLDIQAAFDTVWHNGLLFKLSRLQCPGYLLLIIKSFLENRFFSVKVGNAFSSPKPVIAGVPQGSVLGPLLFNISNYDIPVSDLYDILQFADDTAITFSYESVNGIEYRINSCLSQIDSWYRTWKFKLNADKTELIHFVGNCKQIKPYTRKLIKNFNLNLNNVPLIASQNVKYLGVVFARNGKFNRHIDKTIVKFMNAKNSLNGLIYSQLISVEFKKFLYSVYLRPILSYAAPIWMVPTNLSSHQMERLRMAERKLIRCTHNIFRNRGSFKYLSNSLLYKEFKYKRFDVFCTLLSVRFHCDNRFSDNPLIRVLTQEYNVNVNYFINLKRTDFIYNLWLSNNLFDANESLSLYNRAAFLPHASVYSVAQ